MMRAIALILMFLPFVFGALRLATTGDDARYLWLAFASTITAITLNVRGAPKDPIPAPRILLTLAACSAAAGIAGYLVGARNVISISIVSVAFAICSTLGLALFARVRASAP